MYRSTAKRVKRVSVWAATAALSLGAGVAATNFASVGSNLTSAPTTVATSTATPVTSSNSTPNSTPSATPPTTPAAAPVQTAALTTSAAPTPRTVLSVGAHSITVRGASGALTYDVTSSTVILSGTSHVGLTSIHAGSQVIVVPAATNPHVAGTIGILPSRSGEVESSSRGFDD